tara:strand:- start:532 stop:1182 length:651 start_codon:yes stop_codon:yes gene_type:complete
MSDRNNSAVIAAGSLVFLICGAIFGYLAGGKPSPLALAAPAVIGWLAALAAARPLVDAERRTALYFAFGVLALMIFFIHQTYGYTGRVRNFPLIIGYTGVAICLLDILSLTRTSVGVAIVRFFGSQLDESALGNRQLGRELIAFAAMGGCVLGIWLFGFLVFSPVFVILWMLAGGKTFKASVYGGLFTLAFIYLLFELAFKYELYQGIVFIMLLDS